MEVTLYQELEMSRMKPSRPHSDEGVRPRKEVFYVAEVWQCVLKFPRLKRSVAGRVLGGHLSLDGGVFRGCAAQSF